MAHAPPSDADLIARALVSDDRHAFAELVRRHQSQVRSQLRKLTAGNQALADDLAQETFLNAWRNLKHFRGEAKFSTWLYRIAYNTFISDARRIREIELPEETAPEDLAAERLEDDHAPATSLHLDLDRAMRYLTDAERAAIVQCYHNDLTHAEAAYVLGIPLGTVKTNVLRGKEKLRKHLAAWDRSKR